MTTLHIGRRAAFALACGILAFAADTAAAKEPDKFVVHEWGTFSTFSGSDGKKLKFHPNDRDLPAFVHDIRRYVKGVASDVLVSLETPVLYFYSDRDRAVSVHVDFPNGTMTDWYPQASRPPAETIRWDNLKVLAADAPKLIGDGKGRYFAARETDARPVVSTENGKAETEQFLFYRGVGEPAMPLTVRGHGAGKFTVANTGKAALPAFVFVNVRNKAVSFQTFSSLAAGAEQKVDEPKTVSTTEKLGDAVAALLVGQGLYEKEARAMVKTWSADWFGEDGTRVLYLLAEPQTAAFLPIKIDPKPDTLVRVMVGRHDVLPPERERDVEALVKRIHGDSNLDAKAAHQELSKLGRYTWAAHQAANERLKAAGSVRTQR